MLAVVLEQRPEPAIGERRQVPGWMMVELQPVDAETVEVRDPSAVASVCTARARAALSAAAAARPLTIGVVRQDG